MKEDAGVTSDLFRVEYKPTFNFSQAAIGEDIVYGSSAPDDGQWGQIAGKSEVVDMWYDLMESSGIERVVVLLTEKELWRLGKDIGVSILDRDVEEFGIDNVLLVPIKDYSYISKGDLINKIIPFLNSSVENSKKTVVHCHAGMGRTGHVLSLWLNYGRGFSKSDSVKMINDPELGTYRVPILWHSTECESILYGLMK